MKNKIKVGLIGSGFVGQVAHISSLASIKDVKIVALSELREKLGLQVCNKFKIENFYNNFEEMIDENQLDLVVAIVRRYHTAEVAYRVLKKGINLFTEKPMAPSFYQANKLLKLSKKKKVKYIIGNMRRFDKGVQYVKKFISEENSKKKLGNIISFKVFCYAGYDYCNIDGDIKTNEPPPTNTNWPKYPVWIKSKKEGLEFEKFLNYFSHDINLIRYFFGNNFKVNGILKKNCGNIYFDYKHFYGTFEFIYSNNKIWREGIEINFDNGKIEISLPPAFLKNQPASVKIYFDNGLKKIFEPKFDWTWSFKNQCVDLIKSIKYGNNSISDASDTINDLKVIEKIWLNKKI